MARPLVVREKDLRNRYDQSRSATSLNESLSRICTPEAAPEKAKAVWKIWQELPQDVRDACDDYYIEEQKWDWLPQAVDGIKAITQTPSAFNRHGERELRYCPLVYRKIRRLPLHKYAAFLRRVEYAQEKLPAIKEMLGFDVADWMRYIREENRGLKYVCSDEGDE